MPAAVELSIIIISYNTQTLTLRCLESIITSLKDSKIRYEIIVVDNASSDGSAVMLGDQKSQIDNLHIILNKQNIGFGPANNIGVARAKGEYILLLNSDTVVLDNAVEVLLEWYKSQDSFKFIGGKLLNEDMSPQPSAAPFFTLPVVFGALFLKGDHWGLTRQSPTQIRRVDWISGACIMTQKVLYERLGGFDEKVFMYMEEVDLLYRANKLGYRTGFYPNARFIHLGSASSSKRTYPILQVYKGLLYFYKKHYSKTALILLRILLQLKALIALVIGKVTNNEYLKETYEKAYQMAARN